MTARLYGIKNCDTMKKAWTWLDQHGVAYDFHDYKKVGVDRATLEGWARQVPEGFRFGVKATRRITHIKRLKNVEEETAFFLRAVAALGDRLGIVLFQAVSIVERLVLHWQPELRRGGS